MNLMEGKRKIKMKEKEEVERIEEGRKENDRVSNVVVQENE
jgi:hypothetical protein